MDCAGYQELVAADVDGRLEATEQAAARLHVAGCAGCAVRRRQQQEIKELLRARLKLTPTPDDLRQRVLAAVAREASVPQTQRRYRWRLVLAGSLAAALIAAVIIPRLHKRGPDLLDVLVRDVHAASADQIKLIPAGDVETLRRYYNDSGQFAFTNTVLDLTALGFRPIGGAIVPIGNVAATFTVYESPHGRMICRRFPAGALDLPAGGEPFDGARLFTVGGITIRIVRDGDAICCFASDIPHDILMAYLERAAHH